MALKLPIGINDFQEVIEREYVYVDKTLFVEEVLDQSGKVLQITRPRRFGKTLQPMVDDQFPQCRGWKPFVFS